MRVNKTRKRDDSDVADAPVSESTSALIDQLQQLVVSEETCVVCKDYEPNRSLLLGCAKHALCIKCVNGVCRRRISSVEGSLKGKVSANVTMKFVVKCPVCKTETVCGDPELPEIPFIGVRPSPMAFATCLQKLCAAANIKTPLTADEKLFCFSCDESFNISALHEFQSHIRHCMSDMHWCGVRDENGICEMGVVNCQPHCEDHGWVFANDDSDIADSSDSSE